MAYTTINTIYYLNRYVYCLLFAYFIMPAPDYLDSMLVGYFDYAIIVLVIIVNTMYVKRYSLSLLGCWPLFAIGLLFCLALPILSIWIELDRTRRPPGVPVDGFELLYNWLRFPMYWILFLLQVGFLAVYSGIQKQAALKKALKRRS
ncbi:hypothetical protein BEN49_13275 [Hymenobacter coccineus]|uniref:Transmembrane protein n=1 Tax=Hymenobacter coccineus TaxID=1908235 RepID=A0A1G1SW56_9BACT|nr:hypothetical protein BEN49_13275 [Hymenobacter coccineus]